MMRPLTLRLALLAFATGVIVVAVAPASRADSSLICIGAVTSGLGAPKITLTLQATPSGAFFTLAGQARYSQAVSPPNGLLIYSVSGTATPNDDGFWLSLTGAGYNVANEVFNGTFGIQLSSDTSKNKLTYARQSLVDGSILSTFTGAAAIQTCP
jgi:hypothetical protein